MKISNKNKVAISLLWAAAILSAAILEAPQFLTLILLPVLGFSSMAVLSKSKDT